MLHAHFTTSLGRFSIRLFEDEAPKTVANFVGLAEGTHTIIMERNRLKLFEAVQAFLDEAKRS